MMIFFYVRPGIMLCQHDSHQDSPPEKTHHEPILSFALLLARPAAFLVTTTQKIVHSLSQMTHNDILMRGWASCFAIPTIPPQK
jgi:hypothetical protein